MFEKIMKIFKSENKMWEELTPTEFEMNRNKPGFQCIDVRTAVEYQEWNLPDLKNVDLFSRDFGKQIQKLDKSQKTIVICRSGSRSKIACKHLLRKGFEKVYNVNGGFLKYKEEVQN